MKELNSAIIRCEIFTFNRVDNISDFIERITGFKADESNQFKSDKKKLSFNENIQDDEDVSEKAPDGFNNLNDYEIEIVKWVQRNCLTRLSTKLMKKLQKSKFFNPQTQ